MRDRLFTGWLILLLLAATGCASTEEVSDDRRAEKPGVAQPPGPGLSPDHPAVRTIQIHGSGGQNTLPVIVLGERESVRVAFDILDDSLVESGEGGGARPVSVYFRHMDREWREDLSPAQYMDRFMHDTILDYRPSAGTLTPFTHYEYRFPNDAVDFTVSGNYVLRVTEQGREDQVLFERVFFVSEQAFPVDMRLDDVLNIGSRFRGIQPLVQFRPTDPGVDAFNYDVCFTRNADFAGARCADGPSLAANPDLSFYLEPQDAFVPGGARWFLDLGDVRTGGSIERTNQSRTPWRVWLTPDQAQFPGSSLAPFLNGQPVVEGAVPGAMDAALRAEYVETTFRFRTLTGQPIPGGVSIAGTFNGWHADRLMTWNAEDAWYEQSVLVKQGLHEYRYEVRDPAHRQALEMTSAQPVNMYSSFVYLDDIRSQTDRLVAVVSALVR
ncbi:MAG: DUF5103 domain-containing protein [Rhodothermales bacterium]